MARPRISDDLQARVHEIAGTEDGTSFAKALEAVCDKAEGGQDFEPDEIPDLELEGITESDIEDVFEEPDPQPNPAKFKPNSGSMAERMDEYLRTR
jgi:predicted transcriptional regulator